MARREINARLWTYVNGDYSKITIRPGQILNWSQGGPTEEGWHREYLSFWYDGRDVHLETVNDGRDCDGRLRTYHHFYCPLERLQAHPSYNLRDVVCAMVPEWEKWEAPTVYDEYAQAAGY